MGLAATGTFAGPILGPLIVGVVAEAGSFAVAWLACAGLSLLAALAFAAARSVEAPA